MHAGELAVSSGPDQVTLRPSTGPRARCGYRCAASPRASRWKTWTPIATSTARSPPARLDIAEFAAWRRVFADAVEVLGARTAPGPGRLDPGRIRSVIPWGRVGVLPPPEPTVRRSATTGDAYGAMVRTHAFAVRPGVPRTADEFLAADDPEAATSRYARLDPVDPHVRAGRLVAYATLHPGRTARRILARPESARLPGSATPR